jgi:PRC-barrel domain
MAVRFAPKAPVKATARRLLSIFRIQAEVCMFIPLILSLGTRYKVRNAAGRGLGKIEEIVIDQVDGRVHYSMIKPGGFLHAGKDLIAVPWRRLQMEHDQKSFVLDIDKETLKNAPRFDRNTWPDMTLPEWREHVETYFAYNAADPDQAAEGGEFIESGVNSTSVEKKSGDDPKAA